LAKLVKRDANLRPDFIPKTLAIAAAAHERKATDLRAYDVRDVTLVADCFVLCTVHSEPQARAVSEHVRRELRESGVKLLHQEGGPADDWILMDFGDVIFHIFRGEAREFYDLEGLWGDAPEIELDLED
jgi:ribosome-associated protein